MYANLWVLNTLTSWNTWNPSVLHLQWIVSSYSIYSFILTRSVESLVHVAHDKNVIFVCTLHGTNVAQSNSCVSCIYNFNCNFHIKIWVKRHDFLLLLYLYDRQVFHVFPWQNCEGVKTIEKIWLQSCAINVFDFKEKFNCNIRQNILRVSSSPEDRTKKYGDISTLLQSHAPSKPNWNGAIEHLGSSKKNGKMLNVIYFLRVRFLKLTKYCQNFEYCFQILIKMMIFDDIYILRPDF